MAKSAQDREPGTSYKHSGVDIAAGNALVGVSNLGRIVARSSQAEQVVFRNRLPL